MSTFGDWNYFIKDLSNNYYLYMADVANKINDITLYCKVGVAIIHNATIHINTKTPTFYYFFVCVILPILYILPLFPQKYIT